VRLGATGGAREAGPDPAGDLSAASRTIATLYSDADAYVTLRDALPLLPSRNPREIKRFVNLFRFYSFIAQRGRLIGRPAASREQIAKVAAFAIRWPSVVSMLAAVPDTRVTSCRHSRTPLAPMTRALGQSGLREPSPAHPAEAQAAPSADPPAPSDASGGQNRELRRFMREGVDSSIATQFF